MLIGLGGASQFDTDFLNEVHGLTDFTLKNLSRIPGKVPATTRTTTTIWTVGQLRFQEGYAFFGKVGGNLWTDVPETTLPGYVFPITTYPDGMRDGDESDKWGSGFNTSRSRWRWRGEKYQLRADLVWWTGSTGTLSYMTGDDYDNLYQSAYNAVHSNVRTFSSATAAYSIGEDDSIDWLTLSTVAGSWSQGRYDGLFTTTWMTKVALNSNVDDLDAGTYSSYLKLTVAKGSDIAVSYPLMLTLNVQKAALAFTVGLTPASIKKDETFDAVLTATRNALAWDTYKPKTDINITAKRTDTDAPITVTPGVVTTAEWGTAKASFTKTGLALTWPVGELADSLPIEVTFTDASNGMVGKSNITLVNDVNVSIDYYVYPIPSGQQRDTAIDLVVEARNSDTGELVLDYVPSSNFSFALISGETPPVEVDDTITEETISNPANWSGGVGTATFKVDGGTGSTHLLLVLQDADVEAYNDETDLTLAGTLTELAANQRVYHGQTNQNKIGMNLCPCVLTLGKLGWDVNPDTTPPRQPTSGDISGVASQASSQMTAAWGGTLGIQPIGKYARLYYNYSHENWNVYPEYGTTYRHWLYSLQHHGVGINMHTSSFLPGLGTEYKGAWVKLNFAVMSGVPSGITLRLCFQALNSFSDLWFPATGSDFDSPVGEYVDYDLDLLMAESPDTSNVQLPVPVSWLTTAKTEGGNFGFAIHLMPLADFWNPPSSSTLARYPLQWEHYTWTQSVIKDLSIEGVSLIFAT